MAIIRARVVNINLGQEFDVYIGRGSMFGNKHRIGKHCTRKQAVARYKIDFYKRIKKDPKFKRAVLKLRGKRLGCFCWPKPCHGNVIVEYLRKVAA